MNEMIIALLKQMGVNPDELRAMAVAMKTTVDTFDARLSIIERDLRDIKCALNIDERKHDGKIAGEIEFNGSGKERSESAARQEN